MPVFVPNLPTATSTGTEKYLGVTALGGGGLVRLYDKPAGGSGSTQALMETRTAAAAATIDAAVKSLRTAGYSAVGDGGDGLYKRRSTAPTPTTNPGYFRSVDIFKADGLTDATHGGYWELVPDGGVLRVEQFGGKADYWVRGAAADTVNPSPTDNFLAIKNTWEFFYSHIRTVTSGVKTSATGPWIELGYGAYYVSDTLVPDRTLVMVGKGGLWSLEMTTLVFPAGKGGFWFRYAPELGDGIAGSQNSILRDFCIECLGHGGQTDKHGIDIDVPMELYGIQVKNFGGNGINIVASVESGPPVTNANLFMMTKVWSFSNAGHGVYCQGSDANAGIGIAVNCMYNGGWGIRDQSFLANFWAGCHTDGNALGAYYGMGSNASPVFIGCYSESGQPTSYAGPQVLFIGGIHAAGIDTSAGGNFIVGGWHYGGLRFNREKEDPDDIRYDVRMANNVASTFLQTYSGGTVNGQPHDWCWVGEGYGLWALRYANVGGDWAYAITDESGDYPAGRPGPIPVPPNRFVFPNGMWLAGSDGPYDARMFDTGSSAPTAGTYAVGDRRFNRNAVVGQPEGWVCTQAGSMGVTWAAGQVYVSPTYAKNAGRWYRMLYQATATSAAPGPTHTSGTVNNGVDTIAWEYIGTTDAVWTTFGTVGPYARATPSTVANLTAAATAGAGAFGYVTDATATTPRSTVAGGGANQVMVMSNGTNWLIVA